MQEGPEGTTRPFFLPQVPLELPYSLLPEPLCLFPVLLAMLVSGERGAGAA